MANLIKRAAEKLGKWGIGAIGAVVLGIIILLAWWLISPHLPSEQPIEPNITSSTGDNPIVNTADTLTIFMTVQVAFEPEYTNEIAVIVPNDNTRKCYMVIEFKTSEGFKFLPLNDNLPDNFTVEEGYEYKDVMTVYIQDFPPQFDYHLIFAVYTMEPDTFRGTEQISWEVLAIQYEQ